MFLHIRMINLATDSFDHRCRHSAGAKQELSNRDLRRNVTVRIDYFVCSS